MNHLKVLGIKFIVISIVVYSIFGIFTNANLVNLFWISLLTTGISYLIGDLFVFRRYGNLIATIADFPLAFLSLLVLGNLFIESSIPLVWLSLMAAFFITVCEPFIHAYIRNQISGNTHTDSAARSRLQTEFAEETDGEKIRDRKNRGK